MRVVKLKTLSFWKLLKIIEILVAIGNMSFYQGSLVIFISIGTVIDHEVKDALSNPVSNCSMPFTDFKSIIMKGTFRNTKNENKRHKIFNMVLHINWDYVSHKKNNKENKNKQKVEKNKQKGK